MPAGPLTHSRNDPELVRDINDLQQAVSFLTVGVGVPTQHPERGRLIYLRQDGGTGSTLYVWEGAAWVPK